MQCKENVHQAYSLLHTEGTYSTRYHMTTLNKLNTRVLVERGQRKARKFQCLLRVESRHKTHHSDEEETLRKTKSASDLQVKSAFELNALTYSKTNGLHRRSFWEAKAS